MILDKFEDLPVKPVIYVHYAVWKLSMYPYMSLACMSRFQLLDEFDPYIKHGLDVYRGNVTCPECLKLMAPE